MLQNSHNCHYYYYYYYYYKSTDYSDASQSYKGTLHIRLKKRWYSSQKSVVRQLKQMGLCLPSKRQQRRGGPDLCWQTVPRTLSHSSKNSVENSGIRIVIVTHCHTFHSLSKIYVKSRRQFYEPSC